MWKKEDTCRDVLGPLNPEEEVGVGGPCLHTVMFAEFIKSR